MTSFILACAERCPSNPSDHELSHNILQMQDLLGIQWLALIEEPQRATLNQLLHDAASAPSKAVSAAPLPADRAASSQWIARSPVAVKLRLFCLPYAGGISENVFARQAFALTHSHSPKVDFCIFGKPTKVPSCMRTFK